MTIVAAERTGAAGGGGGRVADGAHGSRPGIRRLVLVAVFVCAACGLVYELALIALGSYLTGSSIERELAMVKVRGGGDHRVEALRLADAFRARVIDATTESFVFEITGNSSKISQFIDLMRPLGLVEVSRTGVAAITRGPEGM